jgi:hypothetical protein
MFNFNRTNRNAITMIAVIIGLIFLLASVRSAYEPRPLLIKEKTNESFFGLQHKEECTPGHGEKGAYYSKSLTPGGMCGGQKLVSDYANYEITGGIGGVLF